MKIDTENLDWPRNVLQILTAEFAARDNDLTFNEIEHLARNADAAAGGDTFEPGGYIDTVAKHVAIIVDDVPDVDAHPELYAVLRTDLCIAQPSLAEFQGRILRHRPRSETRRASHLPSS